MAAELNFTDWAMAGLTALFSGGFVLNMRATGKVESEYRKAVADIWQRIDQINDNRVRREDITGVKTALDSTLDELRIMRAQMVDMSNSLGYFRGKLEKGNES